MRTEEEIRQAADAAQPLRGHNRKRVTGMTLAELLDTDFPEPSFVVDGVIQKGLTILAGRPKLGKSWLTLDIALAVANGRPALGTFTCEQGNVLHLALEDSMARLKSRFAKLGAKPTSQLDIHTEWARGPEAVEGIKRWHDKHQATGRLVIVDTTTRIRLQGVANKDAYLADAQLLEPLQQFAVERDIAVIGVGHTRKAAADDWLDTVGGTTGLTGTADATLVLKRERGQADAVLYGTGRDLPDLEKPLRFDEKTGRWSVLEMSATEAKAGEVGSLIIDILRKVGCGMTAKQIASAIDRSEPGTCNALDRLEAGGMVQKVGRNLWSLTKW